jgi:intracellular multiplication protein IcmK
MTGICKLLLSLFFITINAWAQDAAPTNTQEFEQWLQKNGYGTGAAQTPQVPPTAQAPPGPPPETPAKAPVAPAPAVNSAAAAAALAPASSAPPTLEQYQDTMLNSVPASLNPPDADSQKAFDALLKQNMPLSTDQVIQLRQQVDLAQRAASVAPTVPPKPVSTTLMINLAPGSTPPAIRLAQGYVTSLVFVDSSGAPWPIAAYEIGNPKATNIQWDGKSNILLLQAVSPYSDGNLVIRLASLPTPITLELISGQRVVDFRVDLHIAGIGPNAKELPSGVSLPGTANQLLLNILDGVAPAGSKTLVVKGGDCQGWLLGDRMYLRTRFTVLSPGWIGKMTSSDGMQAYEMPRSASVLISRYGEPVELKIAGF